MSHVIISCFIDCQKVFGGQLVMESLSWHITSVCKWESINSCNFLSAGQSIYRYHPLISPVKTFLCGFILAFQTKHFESDGIWLRVQQTTYESSSLTNSLLLYRFTDLNRDMESAHCRLIEEACSVYCYIVQFNSDKKQAASRSAKDTHDTVLLRGFEFIQVSIQ